MIRYYVIGHPVTHSLSPSLHNALWARMKVNWHMEALDLPDEAAVRAFFARARDSRDGRNIGGFNVTAPWKHLAAELCDCHSPALSASDPVNCVYRDSTEDGTGKLVGYNTDGLGFRGLLTETVPSELSPTPADYVLFGTGGGARAVARELVRDCACELTVVSRELWRAESFVVAIEGEGDTICHPQSRAQYEDCLDGHYRAVVNATSLGLRDEDELAISPRWAVAHTGYVLDLNYRPTGTTPLVKACRAHGVVAVDGRAMLREQAIFSDVIWGIEETAARDGMPVLLE
ncbi:MAG: hypothetical protein LBJ07_03915 [Actinomycetes bacterium]|jgi:shikimate dehydrogenase|nr:hypothetical protein [Actinomycetes bacterium]